MVEPFVDWPEATWMQALAAENNQAETAFLLKTGEAGRYGLRWFTPALEVPLCGHATLAAAHVLMSELGEGGEAVGFDTRSGVLGVKRAGAGYEMDFPADPPTPIEAPAGLAEALGVEPAEVWSGQYLVAVLESEEAVRGLKPNIPALAPFAARAGRGNVGVSSPARPDAGYDVVSRFFAPGSGIAEDPATGSLHCMLSPLYSEKLGRASLRFHQACPGRGGDLQCEHAGQRVLLRGAAVTVLEGVLRL